MKKLKAQGMKILKVIHLILVMIWTAGSIAMAALFLIEPQTGDELYMQLSTIEFIDWAMVIPGALITVFVVGVVYGLFTNWGFFKHRWLSVKWILSVAVILIGSFYFSPHLEQALELADQLRDEALTHPDVISHMQKAFCSAVLVCAMQLSMVLISVFKPWKKVKAKMGE